MRRFHVIGSEVVEAATRRPAAERAWRYSTKPQGAARFDDAEACWGVWCTVTGGIPGSRANWLTRGRDCEIVAFTEAAARAKADDLTREMWRNRAARFTYTAKEIARTDG
jgi:hypothetical protein